MPDFLDELAKNALRSVQEGFYETSLEKVFSPGSLKDAILKCKRAPVIAEIKFASPSAGTLRKSFDIKRTARDMEEGGAVGISVLTEPKHFKGHIRFILEAREQVKVPILMKDIILSHAQIDAASRVGANAILLIQALFERDYCKEDIQEMIDYAHSRGLEVLLEVHTVDEFLSASKTSADMIGINNRNLKTLKVDLGVTKRILAEHHDDGRVIISESGANSPEDIRFLRKCGAHAFLVGTAVMRSLNIKEKVKELVGAL